MPTKSEHLARAEHNQRFAESFELKTTPYPDWVVVAYFYAALHLVDAVLWEVEDHVRQVLDNVDRTPRVVE